MSRSVSYASGSIAIAYRQFECDDMADSQYEFEYLIDWIRETAKANWTSLVNCDSWLGNEDHAILENDFAHIGISEYCGLVSVWLVDKSELYNGYSDSHATLCIPWCNKIAPRFLETFSEYRKIATASNGESFFEKV